jgi:tetratricopeptide (TPR) repeat protein
MRTRAHTCIHTLHTDTQTLAEMPHRRSPSPTRPLSLCCCQIKAWRAGHKGECVMAAARADMRTAAKPTADQMRVLKILEQLAGAADWRGVAAQERAARAVAAAVRTSMPSKAAWVYCILGNAYQSLGSFSKALEHHKEHLAIAKEVGDRAGEGAAYGNLGIAYESQGDFSKAIKYHAQHLAIATEVGDRAGEGKAYANLGIAYQSQGDFSQAMTYHAQDLAIARRWATGRGRAGRTGTSASRMSRRGTSARPSRTTRRTWRLQRRWATGRGRAGRTGTSGARMSRMGDFSQAITYHAQHLAIAKEVGDRAGEGKAYANLGSCHMHLIEYDKAVAYFKAQHASGMSLKLAPLQSDAALNMGVALTLHFRAARQGTATGADQAPGPHSHSSASACLKDRVREAAKWLQAAFDGGCASAKLHLAHLTFEAGQEDAALAHLKEHLSWLVQRGRDICAGCGQTRGEDTPMLTCSGCHVARFCSADHQKMASRKAALGGSLTMGRHKDICRVLNKWRDVVKDVVLPDSCTADLVAFLQR